MKKNGMRPVPPGEILNEEFLKPLGLTANALAKAIGIPPNRITVLLAVYAAVAHRVARGRYLGVDGDGALCRNDLSPDPRMHGGSGLRASAFKES